MKVTQQLIFPPTLIAIIVYVCGLWVLQMQARPAQASAVNNSDDETSVATHAILSLRDGEDGQALRAMGVVFFEFVAKNDYLVKLPEDIAFIRAHPTVEAIVDVPAALKLGRIAQDVSRYAVLPYPNESLNLLFNELNSSGLAVERVNDLYVTGLFSAETVQHIAQLPIVYWIQPLDPLQFFNDDTTWLTQSGYRDHTTIYQQQLTGAGQVGAVADSGLAVYASPNSTLPSCFFSDNDAPPGPTHRKVIGYTIPSDADSDLIDGSGHGTHVAGTLAGDSGTHGQRDPGDGIAFGARLFFQDIGKNIDPFPIGQINPPTDFTDLYAQAYDVNGDGIYQPLLEPRTHSNSWGSPMQTYTLETAQTDAFMWNHPDFLILYAAGNQGPAAATVGWPALAKNIVTVGGTESGGANSNNIGYFSSHGPTPDGRLKPTVSAAGDRIVSALAGEPCATADRIGTSMATPLVQGAALLIRQYLTEGFYPSGRANSADARHPSAALLKALLINSGKPLSGNHSDNAAGGTWPSNGQGWGRVVLDDVLYFAGEQRTLWLQDDYALDGTIGFDTMGQSDTFTITVGNNAPFAVQPLEITLAWSDYASSMLAAGALVNDLQLVVTDPMGNQRLGNDPITNDFHGTPPLVAPDLVNPWEVVYIETPTAGVYTVTVSAERLGSTPLDERKQAYALVATGDIITTPRAAFEFASYTVGETTATVQVVDKAVDSDSVTANLLGVNGSTPVTLSRVGMSAAFSSTVALTGAADQIVTLHYPPAEMATTTITNNPLNGVNPSALTLVTTTVDSYTLSWTLPETTTALSHYVVQESTLFNVPPLVSWSGWSLDSTYGDNSFYSGRGDVLPSVNNVLTLDQLITLDPQFTEVILAFRSRYFNDMNDNGTVEVSVDDGATWQMVRRFYADPRIPPTDTRMQHVQIDLSSFVGEAIRLRFRYNNGIFSQPGESPGWWVDAVTLTAGTWRTRYVTMPEQQQVTISNQLPGEWAYRVQAVYRDGSATGWSESADVTIAAPTALTLRQQVSQPAFALAPLLVLIGTLLLSITLQMNKCHRKIDSS